MSQNPEAQRVIIQVIEAEIAYNERVNERLRALLAEVVAEMNLAELALRAGHPERAR